ncbi:MAG: hypothetical protein IPG43_06095 [Proteobacteria bacterium]|nr:hypothetical protein [Pseudomonadota bacterium]
MLLKLFDSMPPTAWRAVAWLAVAVVLWLSLMTVSIAAELDVWNADKLVHVAMYGSLMLCFSRGYARPLWPRIAVGLGLLGAGIEYLQSLTPDRSASLLDEIANLLGISIMLWLLRRAPRRAPPNAASQA